MRKIILALFLFPALMVAQNTTTLTGTLMDPSGQTWNGAFWTAHLNVPGGGQPVYSNGSPAPQGFTGTLSSSGVFSGTVGNNNAIIPPGSSWTFTICPLTTSPCQDNPNTYVTGSTVDLGTRFSAIISNPIVQAGPLVYAYKGAEIVGSVNGSGYLNAVSGTQYYWNGSAYVPVVSAGGPPTGTAGGDLGGSYPNPTVLNVGHVTTGILPPANTPISTLSARGAIYPDGVTCNVDVTGMLTCPGSASGFVQLNPSLASMPQTINNPTGVGEPGEVLKYQWQIQQNGGVGVYIPFMQMFSKSGGASVHYIWGQNNNPNNSQYDVYAGTQNYINGNGTTEIFARSPSIDGAIIYIGNTPNVWEGAGFGTQAVVFNAHYNNGGEYFATHIGLSNETDTGTSIGVNEFSSVYYVNASPGTTTVTIPSAFTGNQSYFAGRVLYFKKVDSSANCANVTIQAGSATIDGASNYQLCTQYQSVILSTDGTNWHVLADYTPSGGSTITDQTANRADNTVYQNTTGGTLTASGSLSTTGSSTGQINCLVGSTSTPTISDWKATVTATVTGGDAAFICAGIPPNWYYELQSSGAVTTSIDAWAEAVKH